MTRLTPATLKDFAQYQASVDGELAQRVGGQRAFLWIDENAELRDRVRKGEVVTHPITGKNGHSIHDGLVHDWIGVIFLPNAKLEEARDFLTTPEKHKGIYPEITVARTIERRPDGSVTFLRLLKKKIVSAELELEYENRWKMPDRSRWVMTSRTRKVSEVNEAGKPDEHVLPPDTGHGFLWRMNSTWHLKQDDGGVWAELRVVSLSRDTPSGLGWIVKPIIRGLPAESIEKTLVATQRVLARVR